MELAIDLHSHSGYAGGVGQISLSDIAKTMKYKGIDIFGTGDCLLPARTEELREVLKETSEGIYEFEDAKFILQTEVIFSTKLESYKNKTIAHHIILFPNFESIEKMQKLMDKWKMKNTIGRPFITSNSQNELEKQLFEIFAIHKDIEIIPAHVMTPEGILGSKNRLKSIKEFYGNFLPNIKIIETGLSADPSMLEKIPELVNLTYISNSDCHSAAYNRIGREFTVLETVNLSYKSIIESLRTNKVVFTAEFNPSEGRFFHTGHRADRNGHSEEICFHDKAPQDLKCPICEKKMNLGVYQRVLELRDESIVPINRSFLHLIPLVEVIAHSLNVKSVSSKKVVREYEKIISIFESEIAIWKASDNEIKEQLDNKVELKTITQIIAVKNGHFTFEPAGFDGNYGILQIRSQN